MEAGVGRPAELQIKAVPVPERERPGVAADDATKQELMDYCRRHIARYAMPYDVEFRDELPKTLVGKVAYRILEEEELAKLAG